jgi:hypothetical protein
MALDTYAHLQTAIADWLNRSDLTTQIPDFITLCEAEIKRRLRRTSVRDTIDIDDVAIDPPSDLAELRSIHLVSGSPSQDVPLRVCTPETLAERAARSAGAAGRPSDVAIIAGQLVFAPAPDQLYTAEIVYFASLDPLTTTNPTNDVLDEAPDAYLFGALLQAEPYLEHDERIPTWQSKFDKAIDQLNDVRDREEHNASLQPIRLPVVFG